METIQRCDCSNTNSGLITPYHCSCRLCCSCMSDQGKHKSGLRAGRRGPRKTLKLAILFFNKFWLQIWFQKYYLSLSGTQFLINKHKNRGMFLFSRTSVKSSQLRFKQIRVTTLNHSTLNSLLFDTSDQLMVKNYSWFKDHLIYANLYFKEKLDSHQARVFVNLHKIWPTNTQNWKIDRHTVYCSNQTFSTFKYLLSQQVIQVFSAQTQQMCKWRLSMEMALFRE
jgi:hypothetical protein